MAERLNQGRFARLYDALYKASPSKITIKNMQVSKFDPSAVISWRVEGRGGIMQTISDNSCAHVIGKYQNYYFYADMVEWLNTSYISLGLNEPFLKSLTVIIFNTSNELKEHCHRTGFDTSNVDQFKK